MRKSPDHSAVRPYGDHLDDGLVQVSFTLPVPNGPAARAAALEVARQMRLAEPEIVHCQRLSGAYTYFVMFGQCRAPVDFAGFEHRAVEVRHMSELEIERYIEERLGRRVVVVGASTGTDTHSVGIDGLLNVKGVDGRHGLEAYRGFEVHNLGSQVPNAHLVHRAIEVDADAILVSQTVTQQNLHLHNLTELVEIVEAEGVRDRVLLVCGGPRISHELAKELGYDAGFSKGTYPNHLGTYLVEELAARRAAGTG